MVELKIDPVAKPRMTRSDVWKHRPIVDRYYAFKDNLVRLCKLNHFELSNSYRVEFLIKMPESWSNSKRKTMLGKPHQNKPDLDNCIKSVQDCLLAKDQTVYYIEASKMWWDEGIIRLCNLANRV